MIVRDRRQSLRGVGLGVAGVGSVALVLGRFDDVGSLTPALLLLLVVVASAAVGRLLAGFIVAALAAVALTYFFTTPRHSLRLDDPSQAVALAVFAAVAAVVAWLLTSQTSARLAAELAAERTARLHRLAEALAEAPDPQAATRIALEQGIAALGAAAGFVARVDGEGTHLEIVARRGFEPGEVASWQHVPLDRDTPVGQAVLDSRPVYVRARERGRFARVAASPDALAALPLLLESRVVGALALRFAGDREPGPEERSFIET